MRKCKALLLILITGVLVVLLALGFALVQHPEARVEDLPEVKRGP